MKSSIINIRISDNLKDKLELLSQNTELSVSKIARNAIEDYLNKKITNDGEHDSCDLDCLKEVDILYNLEFTELILWIYEMERDPTLEFVDDRYYRFTKTIEKANDHPLFTDEILFEFNKIHKELTLYLNGELDPDCFEFHLDEPDSLDYLKLSDFIFGLSYNVAYKNDESNLSQL